MSNDELIEKEPKGGVDWWSDIRPFSMRYWAMRRCEDWQRKVGQDGPRFPTIDNQEMLAEEVPRRIEGAEEFFVEHSKHKLHPSRGPALGQILAKRGNLRRPEKMRLTRTAPGTILIIAAIDRCYEEGTNFTYDKQCRVLEQWTLMVVNGEPGVYVYEDPESKHKFRLGSSGNIAKRRTGHIGSDFVLRAGYLTWSRTEALALERDLFRDIDSFVAWRKLEHGARSRQGALGFESGTIANEFIHEIVLSKYKQRVRRCIRPQNLSTPDEIWNNIPPRTEGVR